jgi:hypothetical protein
MCGARAYWSTKATYASELPWSFVHHGILRVVVLMFKLEFTVQGVAFTC